MNKKRWLDLLAWVIVCVFLLVGSLAGYYILGVVGILVIVGIVVFIAFAGLFGWAANRLLEGRIF